MTDCVAMRVLIENEAGSRRKNTYDETSLLWQKADDVSAAYPFPYGFVIGTKAGDGDAADCFILTGENLGSGTIAECDPLGLLEQIEDGEVDHKVLAVLPGETFELAARPNRRCGRLSAAYSRTFRASG